MQEEQLHGVVAAMADPGPDGEAEPERREEEGHVPRSEGDEGAQEEGGEGHPTRSHRSESEVAVKEGKEEKNGRGGNGGVKAGQYGKGGEQAAACGSRSYRTSETWSGSSPTSMASPVGVSLVNLFLFF